MTELIAAISTPLQPSGVGVVRLSGPGAAQAVGQVFEPRRGRPLSLETDHSRLVYGTVRDKGGRTLDTAMAALFRAPHSYTGEESAELYCHGSPMVLTLALEALFAAGARQARPGEFTQRAFLNGKLDLTQSEAAADLIHAETPQAVYHAAGQLTGALSERLEAVYRALVDVTAHYHAVLDYPEEELEPFQARTISEALDYARRELEALLATRERGRQLITGIPCAIVGRPNAGKSSLLNALAGYERAIVTPMPGTTRDTVEVRVSLGGVLLQLIDTAGLRESADPAERMGVARSRAAAAGAELILLAIDGSAPLGPEDEEALELARAAAQCICVVGKADLPQAADTARLGAMFPNLCAVSARTGQGLEALGALTARLFSLPQTGDYGLLLTSARQAEAAARARDAVAAAQSAQAAGFPPDAVLADAEEALEALGELTGKTVRADITGRIFERFCVGK
ncbi:tRNA modification GTPase MnmE [bioreactor metagenome]|uniref:tRNA modification GTPase MnmE n=1 Tax=bioreactor metagenome TaxID=1076179 RepID=A0A644XQY2_9ZZZZ